MSSLAYVNHHLHASIAPAGSAGSKMERIRLASRRLGWSFSRTKDIWYADERVRVSPEEILRVETLTGVRYGREEIREIDEFIDRADALLVGAATSSNRPFAAFVRALVSLVDRTGTGG